MSEYFQQPWQSSDPSSSYNPMMPISDGSYPQVRILQLLSPAGTQCSHAQSVPSEGVEPDTSFRKTLLEIEYTFYKTFPAAAHAAQSNQSWSVVEEGECSKEADGDRDWQSVLRNASRHSGRCWQRDQTPWEITPRAPRRPQLSAHSERDSCSCRETNFDMSTDSKDRRRGGHSEQSTAAQVSTSRRAHGRARGAIMRVRQHERYH